MKWTAICKALRLGSGPWGRSLPHCLIRVPRRGPWRQRACPQWAGSQDRLASVLPWCPIPPREQGTKPGRRCRSHRDQRREGGFCIHSGTLGYCWVNSQEGREGPTCFPPHLCPAPPAHRSRRVARTLTPGPPLPNAPTALAVPWCCKL